MNDQPHGGLRLPSVPTGVGTSQEEVIRTRWAMYDTTMNYLTMKVGIVPPKEPDFPCPELRVEDLTTPDSQSYTQKYAEINAWFGYLSEVKARHDAKMLELEVEMKDIETNIRNRMRKTHTRTTSKGEEKAPPIKEMEDAVNSDARYIELKQEELFNAQALKILNARVENVDRQLRLISRQVEIRRLDFEQNNRGSNIQGAGGPPRRGMRYP